MQLDNASGFLFVPANRLDRLNKAFQSQVDCVVVDLEDSVPIQEKAQSIQDLQEWLLLHPTHFVIIRTNGVDSAFLDLEKKLCESEQIQAVILPKCEDPERVLAYANQLNKPLILLIESAKGLAQLSTLAAVKHVKRLALGKVDLALDLTIPLPTDPTEPPFLYAKTLLVMHSRQAGLPPPIDGVWTYLGKEEEAKQYFQFSRSLGFTGALLIHPTQVSLAQPIYSPKPADLEWAHQVLEGAAQHQNRAFRLNGQMIDEPIILAAKRLIQTQQSDNT